jgi:hypothetical protein
MESNRVALNTCALAAVGIVAIEAFARWGIGRWGGDPLTGTALARLADIAWVAMVLSGRPRGWACVGLGRGSRLSGLYRGFVWSAGFGALTALVWGVLSAAGIDPLRLLHPVPAARPVNPAMMFLVGGLIGPVAEEIFFRGLVYGYFRRWGFWPALALSTLIFTVLHAGAGAVPIPQIVGGLVFATAYEVEKKLLAPITIHVIGNLALFSLPYVFRL